MSKNSFSIRRSQGEASTAARLGSFITTSWDDGSIYDLRLAGLLAKNKIPGTFYIAPQNPDIKMLGPRDIRVLSREFEIGAHTLTHPDLTKISLKSAEREIRDGKNALEQVIGRQITSFCYPKGKYNQNIKQLVGLSGFSYARTTRIFERNAGDLLLSGTTVHAGSHYGIDWEALCYKLFDFVKKFGGIYHLWGHSWEIDKAGEWKKIERVLSYIANNSLESERIENGEIKEVFDRQKKLFYENAQEYRKLRFSDALRMNKHSSGKNKSVANFDRSFTRFNKAGKRVLEIGCGEVGFGNFFNKAAYTGIDYIASTRWDGRYVKSDISELGERALGKFDLIILWGIFEDETNPRVRVEKLKNLLRNNKSLIVFTLHNAGNLKFRIKEFVKSHLNMRPFGYTSYTLNFVKNNISEDVTNFGEFLVVRKKHT